MVKEGARISNGEVLVLLVNTKVIDAIEVDENTDLSQIKISGGTDFRPGYDWLERDGREVSCIIYLTDGECYDFPKEDQICAPTLWLLTKKPYIKWNPPFGETAYLNEKI